MKHFGMYIMVLFYVSAGIVHFVRPSIFLKIIPDFLPYPLFLVYLSGLCEILFALMLLTPATRPAGVWLIILLLISVFPANIKMAIDFYNEKNPYLWLTIIRLPLQFVLMWWAWIYRH